MKCKKCIHFRNGWGRGSKKGRQAKGRHDRCEESWAMIVSPSQRYQYCKIALDSTLCASGQLLYYFMSLTGLGAKLT